MNKGIRQDCPIFAILYLFVVEILRKPVEASVKKEILFIAFNRKRLRLNAMIIAIKRNNLRLI